MRFASVCSGIGGAEVAWGPLGWECASVSEVDPFPCAVLAHHFPGVENVGDLKEVHLERGSVGVLVGGTPCQSFSVAGYRRGLKDARGALLLQFVRLAGEARPDWIVWENVPGALSAEKGRALGSLFGALRALGYGWAWRVLDAQFFGLAQRRKRLFVVASSRGWAPAAAVLLEPEGLRGDPPASDEAWARVASNAARRSQRGRVPEVSRALANVGGGNDPGANKGASLVVTPQLLAQGNVTGPLTAHRSRLGMEETESLQIAHPDPAYALADSNGCRTGSGRDAQDTFVISQEVADPLVSSEQRTYTHEGKTFRTRNVTEVYRKVHRAQSVDDAETWAEAEVANTLNRNDVGDRDTHAVVETVGVRRLTPLECERVQGFPDGWTAIPYRGATAADGPRYKALGNAFPVPVIRWIGRRIERVEAALVQG